MTLQDSRSSEVSSGEEFSRTHYDRSAQPFQGRPKSTLQQLRHATPQGVLKAFNTRAFKREQPGDPDLMLEIISDALATNEPVPFVMYWGKGFRPALADPEFKCLDYIAALVERIRGVYEPGARVTLVFTDTHARLNGHSEESISSYFESLTVGARQRGFETRWLSQLMQAVDLEPSREPAQQMPSADLLPALRACAAKWFRGEGTAEEGAILYYQANMLEKRAVERTFPRSIFVTFNGSQLRSLFPDNLPTFYMYSLRHGISDKPWFLPSDFLSRSAPEPARRAHCN